MATKLRAYGYPVLSPFTDDYNPVERFKVEIFAQPLSEQSQSIELIYKITLDSTFIHENMLASNVAIFLDISAPSSLYRNIHAVKGFEGSVTIENGLALGNVTITPQILATKALIDARFENVHPEFGKNPVFSVAAGGVIAFSETISVPLRFKPTTFEGLFVVNTNPDCDPNEYRISADGNVIAIHMGSNARKVHEYQRAHTELKNYLNTSVYKDACVYALSQLFDSEDADNFVWAQAFREKLENLQDNTPEQTDFDTLNPIALRILASFAYGKLAKDIQNV